MNVRDWALIAFTILAQMSVGSFVVLQVMRFFIARKAGEEQAGRLSDRALIAIWLMLILGIIATFFHLGDPLNAYRAVRNLGSSWLSAEIFFLVLFTIVGGLFVLMQWRKIGTSAVRNVIAIIAALLGLALVYSMARIYMLETVPSWNTAATPILFFTTTFLLGSLAMGAALVANYNYVQSKDTDCAEVQCALMRESMQWLAIVSIVLLGVELVVLPLYLASLAVGPAASLASLTLIISEHGVLLAVRLVLAFLGAGVFAIFVYRNALSPGREKILVNIAYAAFVLVLVAELLGRFLFYASEVTAGI